MIRRSPHMSIVLTAVALAGCGGSVGKGGSPATAATPQSEVPTLPTASAKASAPPKPAAPAKPAAVKAPRMVDRPIPFGARRKTEMAAYSRRHYGDSTWRLIRPQVIVEHYTATTTFSSAWNTFASDTRDIELHELPGTCAHFIVDRDGTIYRVVPTGIRCRHTVGLNYTAIGIEHVGMSDGQVMGDRRQLQASLRLTRWLRCTEGIKVRNVIGHNESLNSPYHHENVRALRNQTHGDMRHATMQRYRRLLTSAGC